MVICHRYGHLTKYNEGWETHKNISILNLADKTIIFMLWTQFDGCTNPHKPRRTTIKLSHTMKFWWVNRYLYCELSYIYIIKNKLGSITTIWYLIPHMVFLMAQLHVNPTDFWPLVFPGRQVLIGLARFSQQATDAFLEGRHKKYWQAKLGNPRYFQS